MSIINKQLQKKILKMAKNDQDARNKFIKDPHNKKLGKILYRIDNKNTKEAKNIIIKYGWPTFDLIGKKASNDFWLLVQHADRDINFQKKCLQLLNEAVKRKQAVPKNFAFLEDRVLSAEGKKQKFGTQFIFKNRKLVHKPIQDAKNVDKRRLKYGLNTLKERTDEINKEYKSFMNKNNV